jgi:hypothetical protein
LDEDEVGSREAVGAAAVVCVVVGVGEVSEWILMFEMELEWV